MYFLSLEAPCGKSVGSERWASSDGFSINLDSKSASASCKRKETPDVICNGSRSELWSDTYAWRWPVEEDSSVTDGFVTLEDEPTAEDEEEGDCDEGVDGRLWV